MPLVPCVACQRHIRADHEACPFCQNAVPAGFASRAIPAANRRLDRLAAFTFATTFAVAACSSSDSTSSTSDAGHATDGSGDTGGPQPAYGQPADASIPDGSKDDSGGGVLYGLPPPDAGGDADSGGGAPAYGLPIDAGGGD